MKSGMPPRPPKTISRRLSRSDINDDAKVSSGINEVDSVPHVVRVTILGVAGLLVKPITNADKKSQSTASASVASCSSSVAYPSLLIPLPSNLRVVASIARSQAARGIPSGMSKALFSIDDTQSEMMRLDSWGGDSFEERPESFVAVWDKVGGKHLRKDAPAKASDNHKFVNQTNSLAYEAELRPTPSKSSLNDGRSPMPTRTTTYAPKSFCITVGLVPDNSASNAGGAPAGDDNSESTGKTNSNKVPPPFAIPVGFANLVINGDETLNGQQKHIDLPLSSVSEFLEMLDVDATEDGFFPLIELTSEGLESKNNAEESGSKTEKTKKKNIVKRMFARRQRSTDDSSVYSGTPRSIFDLDRPPNAKERALFLDRYSVDRDAIVRIGLEVFPRGSELEQVFRQKKKSRKFSQACSLLDDNEDETMLESEGDLSSFTSKFFTLHSDNLWDDATMYTDALSSFTNSTIEDDITLFAPSYAESYLTDRVDSKRSSRSVEQSSLGKMLSQFLNCNATNTCGIDEGIDPGQSCMMDVPY
ncbi:hypothetical protein ACHAWU_007787 [Discostella pseudostelligera]|uniref:Uncharacterized protein n=1 Tax=Discostella pseudostelligera TaxID=259834 RepID=A0ABD3LZJ6_9STRA